MRSCAGAVDSLAPPTFLSAAASTQVLASTSSNPHFLTKKHPESLLRDVHGIRRHRQSSRSPLRSLGGAAALMLILVSINNEHKTG